MTQRLSFLSRTMLGAISMLFATSGAATDTVIRAEAEPRAATIDRLRKALKTFSTEDATSAMTGSPTSTAPSGAPAPGPARATHTVKAVAPPPKPIDPAELLCRTGKRQSPIHIAQREVLKGPAEPLQFVYLQSAAVFVHAGRSLRVDVRGENELQIRGARYRLESIVIRHPGEQRIDGRTYPLSMHLMHRAGDGRLANVTLLFEPGGNNAALDSLLAHLPLDDGDQVPIPAPAFDVGALLPGERGYYQYMGSLATPPCTEGVLTIVLRQALPISASQLSLITRVTPPNARAAQAGNGRIVRESP